MIMSGKLRDDIKSTICDDCQTVQGFGTCCHGRTSNCPAYRVLDLLEKEGGMTFAKALEEAKRRWGGTAEVYYNNG